MAGVALADGSCSDAWEKALVERGRVGSGKRRLAGIRSLTALPSHRGLAQHQAFDNTLISDGSFWLANKPFLTRLFLKSTK
jgi:hypothetical protein